MTEKNFFYGRMAFFISTAFIIFAALYGFDNGVLAAELKPDFTAIDDSLILSEEKKRAGISENFSKVVYMPRFELDSGEKYELDLTAFTGADADFKTAEVLIDKPAKDISAEIKSGSVVFRLNGPAGRPRIPSDYLVIVRDIRTREIYKIIRGSIIAAKKSHRARLEFDIPTPLLEGGYEINIAGDMNGWNADSSKLSYDEKSARHFIVFDNIKSGRYRYKFVTKSGRWVYDESNPVKEPDEFGSFNSIFTAGEALKRDVLIPVSMSLAGGRTAFKIKYAGGAKKPELAFFYKGFKAESDSIFFDDKNAIFTVLLDEREPAGLQNVRPTLMFYSYRADQNGFLEAISNEYSFYSLERFRGGCNFRDSIIYFAMTDRFLNGDRRNDDPVRARGLHKKCDFAGGDVDGILKAAHAGYFSDLNADLLWISPVLKGNGGAFRDSAAPYRKFSNYHGYWPYSLDEAEPRFAGFDKLSRAVRLLREKYSIEVILDAVFRHVTIDSPVYKNNKNLFWGIYLKDKTKNVKRFDEYPETTWFDEFLPAFDYSKQEAAEYMAAKSENWIEKSGVGGYRLDAVKHIPHAFWKRLLNSKDKFFTVGETIDSREKIASYIAPGMLSAQFDFPLYFASVETLAKPSGAGLDRLESEIAKSEDAFWHRHKLTSNLIGNHDFPRFTAYADGWFEGQKSGDGKEMGFKTPPFVRNPASYKKLKMAFGLIFSLNGMPLIYYGDEYGECGAGDPDNRRVMRFNGALNAFEKDCLNAVKKLTDIRKSRPALFEGVRIPLLASKDRLVFAKAHFNEVIIAAFNKSDKAASFNVDTGLLTGHLKSPGRAACFYDLITGEKFSAAENGSIKIIMKPLSFRYLEILK